jgi:hypothetical protein
MINLLSAARRVPRAIAGETVSAYEAAIRSITDLERIAARTTTPEPLGVLAAALADLTRDVTTSQPRTVSLSYFASTARRFPICGWNPKTFWPAATRSSRACERPELTRVS